MDTKQFAQKFELDYWAVDSDGGEHQKTEKFSDMATAQERAQKIIGTWTDEGLFVTYAELSQVSATLQTWEVKG